MYGNFGNMVPKNGSPQEGHGYFNPIPNQFPETGGSMQTPQQPQFHPAPSLMQQQQQQQNPDDLLDLEFPLFMLIQPNDEDDCTETYTIGNPNVWPSNTGVNDKNCFFCHEQVSDHPVGRVHQTCDRPQCAVCSTGHENLFCPGIYATMRWWQRHLGGSPFTVIAFPEYLRIRPSQHDERILIMRGYIHQPMSSQYDPQRLPQWTEKALQYRQPQFSHLGYVFPVDALRWPQATDVVRQYESTRNNGARPNQHRQMRFRKPSSPQGSSKSRFTSTDRSPQIPYQTSRSTHSTPAFQAPPMSGFGGPVMLAPYSGNHTSAMSNPTVMRSGLFGGPQMNTSMQPQYNFNTMPLDMLSPGSGHQPGAGMMPQFNSFQTGSGMPTEMPQFERSTFPQMTPTNAYGRGQPNQLNSFGRQIPQAETSFTQLTSETFPQQRQPNQLSSTSSQLPQDEADFFAREIARRTQRLAQFDQNDQFEGDDEDVSPEPARRKLKLKREDMPPGVLQLLEDEPIEPPRPDWTRMPSREGLSLKQNKLRNHTASLEHAHDQHVRSGLGDLAGPAYAPPQGIQNAPSPSYAAASSAHTGDPTFFPASSPYSPAQYPYSSLSINPSTSSNGATHSEETAEDSADEAQDEDNMWSSQCEEPEYYEPQGNTPDNPQPSSYTSEWRRDHPQPTAEPVSDEEQYSSYSFLAPSPLEKPQKRCKSVLPVCSGDKQALEKTKKKQLANKTYADVVNEVKRPSFEEKFGVR
ncbi:hypothetical protein BDV96DRAFT_596482 [Lophiotrema nucula]|uniref:Uncharacterized protein n=1 Tax=Lophiotrema nucula TaxID=690887 RepID=A0A6A5ZKJ7_9PLEO|nr:hypothetical protein BDV96DRAFT_596482 [Lophiotrema nucula]